MSAVAVMCATAHSIYRITPPAHRYRPVNCSMTVGRSHSCRILLLPTLAAAALARCSCRDLCLRGLAGWVVCSVRSLGPAAVARQSVARFLYLLIDWRRHCRVAQCGRCCWLLLLRQTAAAHCSFLSPAHPSPPAPPGSCNKPLLLLLLLASAAVIAPRTSGRVAPLALCLQYSSAFPSAVSARALVAS